jgi:hypothetical protein
MPWSLPRRANEGLNPANPVSAQDPDLLYLKALGRKVTATA